ncbi:MAG: D-alanyl-D-alanine carboxypeptidase [Ferruginibacter sp.]
MKKLLIINYSLLIILASCSVSKQISKNANLLIKDSSLLNAHIGISIFDPSSGKYLYNYQGDKYFVPASNTKLFTCYAGMKYLGDSLTGILYEQNEGRLKIIGNGDPTFLHPDFKTQPVFDFIKKNTAKELMLCEMRTTKSAVPLNALGMGWAWDDYNSSDMAERSFFPVYGNVVTFGLQNHEVKVQPAFFKKYLFQQEKGLDSFEVERQRESNFFFISKGNSKKAILPFRVGLDKDIPSIEAGLLADTIKKSIEFCRTVYPSRPDLKRIHSQPTDSLFKPMMHRSDNFFAEQTLLMVSNEKLGYMNDEAIIDTLLKTDLKDVPQKPKWVDGCGLSRYNLFTPQDFIFILNKIKNEFGLERIKNILATGGTGTISRYYQNMAGSIFAKTGTLSNNCALSGYLITKKGKLLLFSILANNYQTAATPVRRAVEKFINYLRNNY